VKYTKAYLAESKRIGAEFVRVTLASQAVRDSAIFAAHKACTAVCDAAGASHAVQYAAAQARRDSEHAALVARQSKAFRKYWADLLR
jgi:hypothetical protein